MAEQNKAPYEEALSKGIEKLTSEIFIFLLCYTILLIGMAVLGTKLPTELRTLLYILPVLGIGPYLWLRRQQLMAERQTAKDTLLAQIEAGKREYDVKITELESENKKLKNLVVKGNHVGEGATVAGVAALENQTPEALAELAKVSADVSGSNLTKDAIVGGMVVGKKDGLTRLIQSLDEGTKNDLQGLILYLQEVGSHSKKSEETLRVVIRRIREINEEKLGDLLEKVKDLT